jgi:hypothetical protein
MSKRHRNAKQILQDIRSRMDAAALMKKQKEKLLAVDRCSLTGHNGLRSPVDGL